MLRLILFNILLVGISTLYSQVLEGIVKSSEEGTAIQHVKITVIGQDQSATSNNKGYFKIEKISLPAEISFRANGFITQTLNVQT